MTLLRARALLLAGLAASALAGTAPTCPGGGSGIVTALVSVTPSTREIGTLEPVTLSVTVSTNVQVQAYELSLAWDPLLLAAVSQNPDPQFDDDGVFFHRPHVNFGAGTMTAMVDLRHGSPAATGTFRVANLVFYSTGNTGITQVQLTATGLAGPDGSDISLALEPATLTITD